MFTQEQYDAWMMNLSEYFIKKHGYHIVAMPKNVKEIWLVNPKRVSQKILMVTSLPVDQFNHDSIQNHRDVLKKVYQMEDDGLNISVNQEMVLTDELNVVVGPGTKSISKQLDSFKNIETVLRLSQKPERAIPTAVRSLNRQIQKIQRKGARKLMPITTIISTLCIAAYFAMSATMAANNIRLEPGLVVFGAYYKPLIVAGNEWFRLITAGFLHLDIFHLMMNMFALNMIARVAEPVLGKFKYAALLLLGVISGNLFVFIRNESPLGAGLSGGIFALMGWLVVYLFESGAFKNKRLRNEIIYTLMLNMMISMMPGVSFMAHFGGFVFGVFFAVIVSKHKEWELNRKGALVLALSMVVSLGFLTSRNMDYKTVPQLDDEVIQTVSDLGFEDYASRLKNILK